jgi:outer membrane lipoprotein SlyB
MKTANLIRALLLGATLFAPLAATVQAQTGSSAAQFEGRVGTVESVRTQAVPTSGTTMGTVGGAVVGGVLGNQVGQGRGRTLATVGGAAAGGVVGNRMTSGTATVWVVNVRFDDGMNANVEQDSQPPVAAGDRVRVRNGMLERVR